jgi:hypothetical protein
MAETISLRKGSGTRTLTLEGCVTRMKDGKGKVRRTSWMNGVMARARRDTMVAELVAAGWTIEKSATKKTPKSKRRALAAKDVAPHAEKLFVNVRECFPLNDEATLIVIAASQNGDLIGFPESRAEELFLFPRGSNRVIALGATFGEALGAWCYAEDIAPRRVEGRRARFVPA